jgi:preprotein translocase subunit SecF
VAALLTIIGYSINDTIVIYDRIRENVRKNVKQSLRDIINLSVNQTLSRTILTSFTVFLVVTILFFFGGAVIHDFAFALLIGVVVGAYSTVFIASPIVLAFEKIKPSGLKRSK